MKEQLLKLLKDERYNIYLAHIERLEKIVKENPNRISDLATSWVHGKVGVKSCA